MLQTERKTWRRCSSALFVNMCWPTPRLKSHRHVQYFWTS